MNTTQKPNSQFIEELQVDIVTPIYTGIVLNTPKLAHFTMDSEPGSGYPLAQEKIINEMKGRSKLGWGLPGKIESQLDYTSAFSELDSMIAPASQPWGGSRYPNCFLECAVTQKDMEVIVPSNQLFESHDPENFSEIEQKDKHFLICISEIHMRIYHYGFILTTVRITITPKNGDGFFISDAMKATKIFWSRVLGLLQDEHNANFNSQDSDFLKLINHATEHFLSCAKKLNLVFDEYSFFFEKEFEYLANKSVWSHPVFYLPYNNRFEPDLYLDPQYTKIASEAKLKVDPGFVGSSHSCLYFDSQDGLNSPTDSSEDELLPFQIIRDTCAFDAAIEHVHRMLYTYTDAVYHSSRNSNIPELQILSTGIVALIQMNSQIGALISQFEQGMTARAKPAWNALQTQWNLKTRLEDNTSKLGDLERLFDRTMGITAQKQQRQLNQVVVVFSTLSVISLVLSVLGIYSSSLFSWPTGSNIWWILGSLGAVFALMSLFWKFMLFPIVRKSFLFTNRVKK